MKRERKENTIFNTFLWRLNKSSSVVKEKTKSGLKEEIKTGKLAESVAFLPKNVKLLSGIFNQGLAHFCRSAVMTQFEFSLYSFIFQTKLQSL